MKNRIVECAVLLTLLMAPISAYAGEGDPGTGVSGSGSPSSQPIARKQAGLDGHCTRRPSGRAWCRTPRF
jgi:hypothetical protein